MPEESNPMTKAVGRVIDAVVDHGGKGQIPGRPGAEPPSLAEPVEPRAPLPPKPDQHGPDQFSPTGQPSDETADDRAQSGRFLTTSTGTRLPDTDHSLKAGPRGPTLLRDHHLREKITH